MFYATVELVFLSSVCKTLNRTGSMYDLVIVVNELDTNSISHLVFWTVKQFEKGGIVVFVAYLLTVSM